MISKEVIIINKLGLHARAAAKFVRLAAEFQSEVHLAREGRRVNGKSIMGIMMLAASKGTTLELHVSGDDEELALQSLQTLVEQRFGEEV